MSLRSLIDQPIETSDGDSLELSTYSDALAEFIFNCETPVTIGLQGDWGIGKTSLLNMLRQHLKPKRGRAAKYPCIYLNTWQYAQLNNEEYLGISMLNGLISAIERKFPEVKGDSTAKLKRYGGMALRFVSHATTQIIKAHSSVDLEKAAGAAKGEEDGLSNQISDLLENYKGEFQKLVAGLVPCNDDKLVVMIDDLDRVRPSRALELLESIKNFLDVPKCVFILAVDYSVIQQGVVEKLGADTQKVHGKSYFDKIIQVPFNMPISSYRIDHYIMSLLGWKHEGEQYLQDRSAGKSFLSVRAKTVDLEDVKFFTNVTQLTVGANPRAIKRIVNYVNLLKIICMNSRRGTRTEWTANDAKRLYALACMQLEWPEIFSYFAASPTPSTIKQFEDWDFIESLSQLSALFFRTADSDQLKSNISGFFDELISLIDTNEDGDISATEFKPIWEMMTDANLTSAPLEDTDKRWIEFIKLTETHTENSRWGETIDAVVSCMKSSNWNNAVRFRLIPAGKRFFNLVWDEEQVGSLVTCKTEPFQFYLKLDTEMLADEGELGKYASHCPGGHYGIGSAKIDVGSLAEMSKADAIRTLNCLLSVVSKVASARKEKKTASRQ